MSECLILYYLPLSDLPVHNQVQYLNPTCPYLTPASSLPSHLDQHTQISIQLSSQQILDVTSIAPPPQTNPHPSLPTPHPCAPVPLASQSPQSPYFYSTPSASRHYPSICISSLARDYPRSYLFSSFTDLPSRRPHALLSGCAPPPPPYPRPPPPLLPPKTTTPSTLCLLVLLLPRCP